MIGHSDRVKPSRWYAVVGIIPWPCLTTANYTRGAGTMYMRCAHADSPMTLLLTSMFVCLRSSSGEYGRLGHGDEVRQATPKLVEAMQGKAVTFIAAGGFHTACIVDGGNLYTWGGGYFGQLGHGDETDRKSPKLVKGVQQCVAHVVACGTHHSLMLTESQEVWTWGSGEFGKLGIGDEEKHTEPIMITALQGMQIVDVATGGFHSAALTDQGLLYTWGGGDKGQLGHGDENSQNMPMAVEALRGKRVVKVSTGMHHTMALLDNGDVYSWGSGEYGRLGHDDEQMQTTPLLVDQLIGKGVKEISAGGFHSMALATGSHSVPDARLCRQVRPFNCKFVG
jgi:RCC1 and BTB domain-containing protein